MRPVWLVAVFAAALVGAGQASAEGRRARRSGRRRGGADEPAAGAAAATESTGISGATEEKEAATAEIVEMEDRVASLEDRVKRLRAAKPDPELKRAVSAALRAEQELLADKDAEEKWNATVAKLSATAEMWRNVSAAEEAMQSSLSSKSLAEGDVLAEETERLDRLRKALAHTTENARTSLISDGILHASKAAREALAQLRTYEHERDETKEEFVASLGTIGELMRRYAKETKEEADAGSAGNEAERASLASKMQATHAMIGTKQSLARIQRERLLELNNTIVEQRALLQARHDELDRLTQSQKPDNATNPSPHTRELRAKERTLEKMVEMLAGNVSLASANLAADRARAESLAKEEGKTVRGPESATNKKLSEARKRLANATHSALKAAALESRLRQAAEDASLVEDAERKKEVGRLEAKLASAQEQLTLAKEKLEGEIEADEASETADEAAETAQSALSRAEESNFEAKAREVRATQAEGSDAVAPWDRGDESALDKTSKAAKQIRRIVGKLLWSEGHDAAAQDASRQVIKAVRDLMQSSGSGSNGQSKSADSDLHKEIKAQEAKLRGAQSTQHLDSKIAAVQKTMDKSARFKSKLHTKISAPAAPPMKTIVTGHATGLNKEDEGEIAMQIVPKHCFDGEKNKGESGTDCGGACPRKCGEHKPDFIDHHRSSKFHRVSVMERKDLTNKGMETPIMVKSLVTVPHVSGKAASVNKVALLEETKRQASDGRKSFRLQQRKDSRRQRQGQTKFRRLEKLMDNDY